MTRTWRFTSCLAAALALAGCSCNSGTNGGSGAGGGSGGASGPAAPAALTITSADKSAIGLSWPASGGGVSYLLQRGPTGGAMTTIAEGLTVTTYTDGAIDPYTDYTYQVQAVDGSGRSTFTATSHPAGPPPGGFAMAARAPDGNQGSYGAQLSWAQDGNGDPAMAFVWEDRDGDGDDSDNVLEFVSWSRKDFAWKAPVQVAVSGKYGGGTHGRATALARDEATGGYLLAFTTTRGGAGTLEVRLARSADGSTWSVQDAVRIADVDVDQPDLVVAGGTAFLSFFQADDEGSGFHVRTGPASAAADTWGNDALAPLGPDGSGGGETAASLAVDGAGAPALAYWVNTHNNSANGLRYWKVGSAQPVVLADTSADGLSGSPDVALAFDGTKPRVVLVSDLTGESGDGDIDPTLGWFIASDDGVSWPAPTPIPNDNQSSLDPQIDLALGPAGQVAMVADSNTSNGEDRCGQPKLSTSTDLTTWRTCSPDTDRHANIGAGLTGFNLVRYGPSGKLDIAGHNSNAESGALTEGVFFWHQS